MEALPLEPLSHLTDQETLFIHKSKLARFSESSALVSLSVNTYKRIIHPSRNTNGHAECLHWNDRSRSEAAEVGTVETRRQRLGFTFTLTMILHNGCFASLRLRVHPLASGCSVIDDTVVQPSGCMSVACKICRRLCACARVL